MPCLWLLVLPHTLGHQVSDTHWTVACKFRNLFLKQTKQTMVLSLPVKKIIKGTVAGRDFSGKQARLGRAGPLLQLTAFMPNWSDGSQYPITPLALHQEPPTNRSAWADPAISRKTVQDFHLRREKPSRSVLPPQKERVKPLPTVTFGTTLQYPWSSLFVCRLDPCSSLPQL